jgi:hypothetical protein
MQAALQGEEADLKDATDQLMKEQSKVPVTRAKLESLHERIDDLHKDFDEARMSEALAAVDIQQRTARGRTRSAKEAARQVRHVSESYT